MFGRCSTTLALLPSKPAAKRTRSRSRSPQRTRSNRGDVLHHELENYNHNIEALATARGYPCVGPHEPVYLDFCGAALACTEQSKRAEEILRTVPPGNPHTNQAVSELHEGVRQKVLQFFGAPPDLYTVIFTSNATAGLRIVAESFPFAPHSFFAYDIECHTSVLGMRQRAKECGARAGWFNADDLRQLAASPQPLHMLDGHAAPVSMGGGGPNLIAVTAESNFSGATVDLKLIEGLRRAGWKVMLDAGKRAASKPLDLWRTPVDYMAVSFYKIFGRPTGLGALLIHRDAADLLMGDKVGSYFGGGTIAAAAGESELVVPARDRVERFQLGTPNFFGISELPAAFEEVKQLHGSLARAGLHAKAVAADAVWRMSELRHSGDDRRPLCELYGNWTRQLPSGLGQGPTIAFNLLDSAGEYFPFKHVDEKAKEHKILLRSGHMCNYGACQKYLGLTNDAILKSLEQGHSCLSPIDVVDGRPTGAVRVSFGPTSSLRDVERLIALLRTFLDTTVYMEVARAKLKRGDFDAHMDPSMAPSKEKIKHYGGA